MRGKRSIFLWSAPRAVSTAFCRMMIERGDFTVLHEPFSSLVVQGYVLVDGQKVSTSDGLVEELLALGGRTPIFVKETTEYRYDAVDHPALLAAGTHTFLIRSPADTIASHYAMNPAVRCGEVGFQHLYEIFERTWAASGRRPVVIEAEDLVRDPHETVRRYCGAVGIPFVPAALTWPVGDRPEWSRTSKWHRDTALSTGFERRVRRYPVRTDNNAMLAGFHAQQLPFYERLQAHSMTRPDEGAA